MVDYTIDNEVPAALRIHPIKKVEAALNCSNRTLVKRLAELEIPIAIVSHNVRGLAIPDMQRLVEYCVTGRLRPPARPTRGTT